MIIDKAEFLVPSASVDKTRWAVIACDQFTSQREYWSELSAQVADAPSTLSLIYPEVYLKDGDKKQRIDGIREAMKKYEKDGTLVPVQGVILVDRTISDGRHRTGLVAALDLEEYEFTPVNNARVKATERTVEERLPARIEVREGATLECSHVMLLTSTGGFLRRELGKRKGQTPLYDFALNMKGGRLKGYLVEDCDDILAKLEEETEKANDKVRYAVGDGNHSLATAKRCWEKIKSSLSEEERKTHPARFATVEVVELCDESLDFEPIHRVLFGAGEDAVGYIAARCGGDSNVKAVWKDREYSIPVSSNTSDAIADLQKAMDEYLIKNPSAGIDYVHGDDNAAKVAKDNDGVAIFMPTVEKDTLFDYVARRGVLPRKSFSMGNAEDKRYYYETKKIK